MRAWFAELRRNEERAREGKRPLRGLEEEYTGEADWGLPWPAWLVKLGWLERRATGRMAHPAELLAMPESWVQAMHVMDGLYEFHVLSRDRLDDQMSNAVLDWSGSNGSQSG